jgi:hypothetical protein
MARKANPATDFDVTVEDIGLFTFARRTMADEFAIQRKFADLAGGGDGHTTWLELVGGWVSALSVLTVRAPEGWDIATMDPLDDEVYAQLNKVYDALRSAEDSFRGKRRTNGQAGSEAAGNNN